MFSYSVIIPHAGSIELLERALASIPAEREDVERIVISDGTFAGVGRNEGMAQAKGKWLLFLDDDDYFLPGAFEEFDKYLDSEADMVFFKGSGRRCGRYGEFIDAFLNGGDEDGLRFRFEIPSCRMVRREMVETYPELRFGGTRVANDTMFALRCGYRARRVDASPVEVYHLTYRDGSLRHSKSLEDERERFSVILERYAFLRGIGRGDLARGLFNWIRKAGREFGIGESRVYLRMASEAGVNLFGEFFRAFGRFLGVSKRKKRR